MSDVRVHLESLMRLDPGPMARLEALKGDESAPGVVFARVCEGKTLAEVAQEWGLPKGRFVEWFSTAHAQLYDAALKVRADELAHGALADAQDATVETVSADKLRVETKLRVAGKWDRTRYGEHVKVERVERFEVDERLVELASALLETPRQRVIEQIEQTVITVLPEQVGEASPPLDTRRHEHSSLE